MKIEKETAFVLAFLLFYFALLLTEYPKYGVFWDEGGHLSNGFFVGEGIKTFINTLSVQQTVGHLKALSEQYNVFQVLHYPPLFYTLEGVLFAVIGPGELPGKVLSMLFSIGAVFVTYLLGREIYGPRAGVISALFLAASPLFFRSSLMAMMDTATAFFFALSVYAFILFLKNRMSYKRLGVIIGMAFLTRFELMFVIPIVLLHRIIAKDKAVNRLGLALLIGLLMATPWYALSMGKPAPDGGLRLVQYLDGLLFKWHYAGASGFDPAYLAGLLIPSVGLAVGVLGLMGIAWILLKKERRHEEVLLLLWPAVIYLFFSFAATRVPRYSISYLPAIALLAGGFANKIIGNNDTLNWKTGIAGAIMLILVVNVMNYEQSIAYLDAPFANYQYRIPAVERSADYLAENAAGGSVFLLAFRNEMAPATMRFYVMTKHPDSGIRYRDMQSSQIPESGNVTKFREMFEERCPNFVVTIDNKRWNENAKQLYDITAKNYIGFITGSEKFVLDKKFENAVADIVVYRRIAQDCGT